MIRALSTNRSKVLVVAANFPPTIGGSQTLLYNLFRYFPSDSYAAVSQNTGPFDPESRLPCSCYYAPNLPLIQRIYNRVWPLCIPLLEKTVYRAQLKEKAGALFLNLPDGAFLIAGWRLARKMSLPYYVFLHDLWEENERYLNVRVARHFEKQILTGAETVFTITDRARQYYLDKYNVDSKVLLHTIDPEYTNIPPRTRLPWTSGMSFRIVASGSFYPDMNLDTLRSLNKAIIAHPDENIELRILTQYFNQSFLEEFCDPRITIKSCTKQEVWQELGDADLLYVPLSFRSRNPAEIETVFPTKVTEYALADVPIIVHGPAHCYTVDYARRRRWAYTVYRPDPDALWKSILHIRDNEKLRKRLSGAGRRIVKERNARDISIWLQKQLGIIPSG
jgi:glycosyltransferase involved in cell wall biosynthesis